MNLRPPVLRTGVLPLNHWDTDTTQNQTFLSYFDPRLSECKTHIYSSKESNATSSLLGFTFIHHHHLQSALSFTAAQEPRLQFCPRQVFHRNIRNQDCSFTWDWIGAVDSSCFPHPTLSLTSGQTLKDLKKSRGTNVEVRRVDLANWAFQTSPKFTKRLNICSIRIFEQIRDPEIPVTIRPLLYTVCLKRASAVR